MRRSRAALLASAAAAPGMPEAGRQIGPPVLARFYHTETFQYLIARHADAIEERLIAAPSRVREEWVARPLAEGEPDRAATWAILRAYLDEIEARIAGIARGHSPGYWLHLYRRILPVLSSKHVGKRDNTTVVLVRQIAELAYLKHGNRAEVDDLGSIKSTTFETFLGGHYKAALTVARGSAAQARAQYREARSVDQSVMTAFSAEDLLAAFEVEGLAYEYWKVSAAMRSLGKGVDLAWDPQTRWIEEQGGGPHPLLFAIFDHRIVSEAGLHTRLGTWTKLAERGPDTGQLHFLAYNPNPAVEDFPMWDSIGKRVVHGSSRLNFRVGQLPWKAFATAHAFMSAPFEARHGVRLDAVLFCLWVASFFSFFPDRAIFASDEDAQKAVLLNNFTNLCFRGYKNVALTLDTIADEALWWAKAAGEEAALTRGEVRAAFEFLSLTDESAGLIGLWSGGKRPLLIPAANDLMIDLAAIVPIFVNLFFGVREESGAKGFVFEESMRDALTQAGLSMVHAGTMEFADGTCREVDAAVRIGNRLVVIESFSFERPVDYELAKPGIFEQRNDRISRKIAQAATLADAIRAQPKGANFDFSWARGIDWRLATPSVEFTWALNADLFDADGMPRVLQLSELVRFLKSGEDPIRPFSKAVAVLREGAQAP